MSKVLLLSHGDLAREIWATSNMVLGEMSGVEYLTLPLGTDLNRYEQDIRRKIEDAEDGLLILTDIFGGTPFITASRVFASLEDKDRVEIVTGMNLAMAIQVFNFVGNMPVKELKKIAVTAGTEGIVDLKERI
ncbi:PTS sugar transporter subunit IIA [Lacrimispora saccharolytica]|uniref:PTS system fructose subfamily IIA component n=1 Tax=Lacrimispora saccharolytica (strain ATCC 35040 / DSM 2544 / NRCC 2533 / WM1) TaxID=610130 RepID=D9R067_LACSW|nr:PTS sugar transporter subunit IIA [Lacrimispora saccharolytica]ADL04518.1 PTS system fructose subfamily IIA component [[Clostridium] saccharolyticum WM1]QRV21227.1 PTS sugar transporter subunit IIA [Lacrimispora saccharolytica]